MIQETLTLYKRLWPYILPYWKRFVLACACTIPLSLCAAGIAYLVKPVLDDVFLKKDLQMLKLVPFAIILLYTVKGAFTYTYHYVLGATGTRIITDMRNRIFFHLQTLPLSFFAKNPTGFLMSRITNDVSLLQRSINTGVIEIFKESVTIVGLVAVLLKQDLKLACIALVIMPWAIIPIWRFGKKGRKFSTRGQQKVGKIATYMHETIAGCRIVKAFGMEEYENKRFSKENVRLLRIRLKRLKIRALSAPVMEFIGGLAGASVIFYGGYNVLNGNSTPGTFFSFVAALLLLYGPLRIISTAWQDIQEGLAAAVRVFQILDTRSDIIERSDARTLHGVKGAVSFSGVCFAYEDEPVLRDITLAVEPGEVVAVVGMTGSGKTTLVSLIPRFNDTTSGTVAIDGHDVRDVTLGSLRSQISLVSQHPYLFNDTVLSNIAYGDPSQSKEAVIEAARTAYAHDFIDELPDGYDTVIGEHGVKLSGGQRQRLALARAILRDAPILIFDEATSSLDTQLEKKIQQSLSLLIRGRTTIIISHRLSTIRSAGRIIVLAGGTICEQGTHSELLERGGEYAKLYSIYVLDENQQVAEKG